MSPEIEQRDDSSEAKPPEEAKPAPSPFSDRAISNAVQTTGITAIVLTVVMSVVQGVWWSVGTMIGGVLATLNLLLFARMAEAFIAAKGKSAPWAVLGGIKLLGLFLCVFVILRRGDVSALAFIIGYGALPIGISVSTLRRPPEA